VSAATSPDMPAPTTTTSAEALTGIANRPSPVSPAFVRAVV
jgi:hypothetical protein